ncbi:hypothetical protein ACI01nite_23120 [Acetobacter cibinongensis]|uniref:Glycosyl transferase family 1 domain-containing protein n=1 Tax=Acetobacter cibinongensis TaxID=146475 RepID=A0A0D6N7R1_9PROT|nr:glycosyltransferase family 4 protein [Acetobacter cibinongensis]GAN61531.1 hypothetical protein Abci_035_007 [Acetobacter cibinongensis]GBQ15659.1 hypothetical protein AA0482_1312 [Acetobacter cibinongensis NRIC 0482]GEL59710.1 hypothetical protein ACI01nite_23120 [Acetobacter cibinongensis]
MKIIFINPFSKSLITGGIKVTYQHAKLLLSYGYDVRVFQPEGFPEWLNSGQDKELVTDALSDTPDSIFVFPEPFNGWLRDLALTPTSARKVIFCQNQYYMFMNQLTAKNYRDAGFEAVIVPSHEAKYDMCSIIGFKNEEVHVVPAFIDRERFYPTVKEMKILTAPRKWPAQAGLPAVSDLLQIMFRLKYPKLSNIPWIKLENFSVEEVAKQMGSATVFLSLSRMESLALSPLEAMASRCAIVGYHGTGGLEYATRRNGLWFSPEEYDPVVDALARALLGVENQDKDIMAMLENAEITASFFNKARTQEALLRTYGFLNDKENLKQLV